MNERSSLHRRERAVHAKSRAWSREAGALPAVVVVICGMMSIGGASADSGDAPVGDNPNAVQTYTIPDDACNTVRDQVANQPIDLIVACSKRPTNPGADYAACDLLNLQNTSINAGVPVGQCRQSFPVPLVVAGPSDTVLEANTDVLAVAAGSNLALGDRDQISVTAVAAGLGTVLGLVDVQPCGAGCPSPAGPPSCGGIPVTLSQVACDAITSSLAQAAISNPPDLSHALLFDVQETANSSFLNVLVCTGYQWSCRSPSAAPPATSIVGQVPFSIVYTPLTFTVRGTTITRKP